MFPKLANIVCRHCQLFFEYKAVGQLQVTPYCCQVTTLNWGSCNWISINDQLAISLPNIQIIWYAIGAAPSAAHAALMLVPKNTIPSMCYPALCLCSWINEIYMQELIVKHFANPLHPALCCY